MATCFLSLVLFTGETCLPRGKWAVLSIRVETKRLLFEKCSGFHSIDDCLTALFTGELWSLSDKSVSEMVDGGQFTSELKNFAEHPAGQALFTGELKAICDEIVRGVAALIRAYGYTFHADVLVDLYKSRETSTVFNRSEYLNRGIDVSLLSDVPRLVFDVYTSDYTNYELRVKYWLKPCFGLKTN